MNDKRTMSAWLMTAPDQPLEKRELPLEAPVAGELTVDITGCGVGAHVRAVFNTVTIRIRTWIGVARITDAIPIQVALVGVGNVYAVVVPI